MKTETKIKLSPKQKEVIRRLRGSEILTKGYFHNKFILRDSNGILSYVDGGSVNGLEANGLIYNTGLNVFDLTRLGKTIDIN